MKKINIIFIIFFLFSCNNKYIKFDEYLINNYFIINEIIEDSSYKLGIMDCKFRIILQKEATHYSVYNNPYTKEILFRLKYKTEITPIEVIKIENNFWVKIKTYDNKIGWIKSQYIEVIIL